MKKLLLVTLIVTLSLIVMLAGCSSNLEQVTTESTTEDLMELIKKDLEKIATMPTEIEYTEDEYKNLCQELYYDDFFDKEPYVGQYVKFYGFISGKYKYNASDMFGIVIEDIDDKYNFRKEYLGCCVLHEETKDSAIPSYFGKSTYLMFPSESDLLIENYESGQYVVVYGEVVQIWSGIFIIPKYIEEE